MTPSHPSLSLTLKAAHAAWWSFLEVGTRYLVQFGLMVALARLLTPSDFGVMAILLALTSFSALLVEGGMGSALIQRQTTSANEPTEEIIIAATAPGVVMNGAVKVTVEKQLRMVFF